MEFLHFTSSSKRTLQEANTARDRGMPLLAAEIYRKYLNKNPSKGPIWIQAGNAFKDCGKFSDALECYENALAILPNDSDLFLQRGHLFKLMGRIDDSINSYKKSISLDHTNQNAQRELMSIDQKDEISTIMPENIIDLPYNIDSISLNIWFDVTDLMIYAKHNDTLSGIQRVVANLIMYAEKGYVDKYKITPVVPDYENFRVKASNISSLVTLVRLFDEPTLDRNLVNKTIQYIESSYIDVFPEEGDIFTTAGAFWIYPHYDYIREIRKNGMRFCLFIHDLIQIANPEYCAPEARIEFQTQLVDVLSVCDFVLTNSHFVAQDVKNYIEKNLNYCVPVYAVPLPTELKQGKNKKPVGRRDLIQISKQDYVLCVSTIEIRKNHIYLVKVWERLIQEFGEENVPKLVFVGKWGWQIEEFKAYLDDKGYVGDWLFIFNNLSDSELEFLYRNSLFTSYTSFAEGFGLPIGESLVYGKPCIASNTTSMPEVGGKFVRYIDPYNVDSGYNTFREAILDRKSLENWENDIKKNFKVKTWAQFCSEYFETTISVAKKLGNSPGSINCLLPEGQIIKGGTKELLRLADTPEKKIILFRAARDTGWYPMEDWGAWSSTRRSSLTFDTPLKEGTCIKIFMNVCCPPGSKNPHIIVHGGDESKVQNLTDNPEFFWFIGKVGDKGRVRINIISRGKYGPTGERNCHVGLQAIGYSDVNNASSRINILEDIVLYKNDM